MFMLHHNLNNKHYCSSLLLSLQEEQKRTARRNGLHQKEILHDKNNKFTTRKKQILRDLRVFICCLTWGST